MKQVLHQIIQDFVYDSKEERDNHVAEMVEQGWEAGSRVKRLKPEVSIMDTKDVNSYEWFATFQQYK